MKNPLKRKKDGETPTTEGGDGDGKGGRRFTRSRILLVLLAVVLVGLIIWMATQLTGMLIHDDTVEVPKVVGLPQAEAEAALTEAGLVPKVELESSEEVAEGIVISQSVDAEQKVNVGREITITVSSGGAKVEVPNLVGSSQRIAELTLTNLGLLFEIDTEYNSDVDKDQVILQSPEGGTQVAPGSTVKLLVSLGEEPVSFSIINMVGLTLSEAQKYISDNKLNLVNINRERSDEVAAGIVIGQSPESGVTVYSGDEVSLTVSEGPGPVLRTYAVNYTLPEDLDDEGQPVETMHNVVINVSDIKGSRDVYNQSLTGGSNLFYTVEYYTRGTVSVYVDGASVLSVSVP